MKKFISLFMSVLLIVLLFASCSEKTQKTENPKDSEKSEISGEDNTSKIKIVATTFPQYDWVRQIIGDKKENFELTLLMDSGVDLHSYQPTVEDIATISSCDIFIYIGGESDSWVNDALSTASNPDMVVINLFEVLGDGVKEEEIIEGMEDEHAEDEHVEDELSENDHEKELDEHIWLSLKNAKTICSYISIELGKIDPENLSVYQSNADEYIKNLDTLDKQYEQLVENSNVKTLLFADRFPFRYLADDYGLKYYAAFTGCSAETEASFETIAFLANKTDELTLKNIMVIDNSNESIAKTIIENTKDKNHTILALNSMQSVTAENINSGTTYLSIMKDNFDVLKQALS